MESTIGQVIDLNSPEFIEQGRKLVTKTDWFQVLRLDLPKDKQIPTHQAAGPITVQCLFGDVTFFVEGKPQNLRAGCWLCLEPKTDHALTANEDSAVLVTKLNP